jgi:hypothetical protein
MKRNRKFCMERLEDRQMMAGDFATGVFSGVTQGVLDRGSPVIPAVPAYSSNPGAAATLYLDFNGHFEAQWGNYSNAVTPVFSMDEDSTTFASYELAAIKEVWQRVSEDFAPFNINVTTVDPGNFDNGKALRVAIGGSSSDWYHAPAGGVAYINSFTSSVPNTVYVFSRSAPVHYIADGASQEAGHAFGLYHQSVVDANGILVQEYAPGTDAKSPLMGFNIKSQRTTWWNGTSSFHDGTKYVVQDDMAMIASAKNGFGYRPDDLGNTYQTALPMGQLSAYGPISNQFGIIGTTSDTDWFQFNVMSNGRISLQVDVAQVGANLDAKVSLFRLDHHLNNGKVVYDLIKVATSEPATSLNASVSANVTPGNYFAVVGSHGEYGDIGQYTLKGSFSKPLTVDGGLVVGPSLTATSVVAPTNTTVIQPTLVSSSSVTSSTQLLTATASSRNTSAVLQSTSSLATTSASLRAAAVDEALATRVSVKTYKLPNELFDLLASG